MTLTGGATYGIIGASRLQVFFISRTDRRNSAKTPDLDNRDSRIAAVCA